MRKSTITSTVSPLSMPDLTEVSYDVSEASHALANAASAVTYAAMRAGHAEVRDVERYIKAHDAAMQTAAVDLNVAIARDIADAVADAVEAERRRCRDVEYSEDVRAARMACAETRPIAQNAAGALADAQDVHRKASDAYKLAFDSLETALELADAGTGD